MYCKVMSAVLKGLKTEFVCVETDIQNGLPMLHMVGCLASEVKESGERIKAAAKNMGMGIPAKKIIVNLAPAWVRKSGAAFDLPIGVSILGALMEIPKENLENVLILGELGRQCPSYEGASSHGASRKDTRCENVRHPSWKSERGEDGRRNAAHRGELFEGNNRIFKGGKSSQT